MTGNVPEVQGDDEAVCWDGGWSHKGLGNLSKVHRVQLHLIFAPKWMVMSRTHAELSMCGATANDAALTKRLIEQEYNGGFPLANQNTGVGYWLDQIQLGDTIAITK